MRFTCSKCRVSHEFGPLEVTNSYRCIKCKNVEPSPEQFFDRLLVAELRAHVAETKHALKYIFDDGGIFFVCTSAGCSTRVRVIGTSLREILRNPNLVGPGVLSRLESQINAGTGMLPTVWDRLRGKGDLV
jgi:hypothetical protein